MPTTLPAFSDEEKTRAHIFLATKVAQMMGRTFEEADWTDVYCAAKGIPTQNWSNLKLDINHQGLGVEQKKLGIDRPRSLKSFCGKSLMHPSETRSIRVPDASVNANEAMADVLMQYKENLNRKRKAVRETCISGQEPDLRTGLLLYQKKTFREFMYFEQPAIAPDPQRYYAEWNRNPARGERKASVNLWVYEKGSDRKKFSITTTGSKIQPYFDIPPPNDPNLYLFIVQGEQLSNKLIRIWITIPTARELKKLIGNFNTDSLSKAILDAQPASMSATEFVKRDEVQEILLTEDAYVALIDKFKGVSDEHRMQLFVEYCLGIPTANA